MIFSRLIYILLISFWISIIFWNPTLLAQPSISFELEPREITVGDPVEMVLRLKVDEKAIVQWPRQDDLSPAEILKIDTLSAAGEERAIRYTVSVFEPGSSELPDLPIAIQYEDHIDTVWIDPGTIEVISIIEPEDSLSGIRDIKPPIRLAWTWRDALPYVIAFVIVILLGIAGYLLWRHHRRLQGELPVYVPPPPPPYTTALRRMENLRLKKLWQGGYIKEYYSELTEIIKHYIGGRFGINAPEMTTMELFGTRNYWSFGGETLNQVKRIVNCADMVKFAKFMPDRSDHTSCMDAGFDYLKATKPEEDVVATADIAGVENTTVSAEKGS